VKIVIEVSTLAYERLAAYANAFQSTIEKEALRAVHDRVGVHCPECGGPIDEKARCQSCFSRGRE